MKDKNEATFPCLAPALPEYLGVFLCFLCSCEDLDDEESSELDDFYVMFIDSIGVF